MSVIHITESAEFQKAISTGVALVDFSASWCGPCKRVEPVFKELAKENPTVKFIHVDVDEASDSMSNELENVSGVPHFELFHNGVRISQFSGANMNKIKESVKLLKSKLELTKEEQPNERPKEDTKQDSVQKEEPAKEDTPKEDTKQDSVQKEEPAKEDTKQDSVQKEEPAKEESKIEENKNEEKAVEEKNEAEKTDGQQNQKN